jgi:Trypsin-co-occurring domain 1
MNIDQAEVQLSLSFEAEGNLYITKSKANANMTVKLVLKPKSLEKTP